MLRHQPVPPSLRPAFVLAALALGCACSRDTSFSSAPLQPPLQPAPSAAVPSNDASFRFASHGRVIAIGDLHGDVDAARRALRLGGAIDPSGKWVGAKLVVVQVGDQIDRGDTDREVIDLFDRLEPEAAQAGGAVFPLNGNHETMNVAGDFTYTSEGGFADFEGAGRGSVPEGVLQRFAPRMRARAAALSPGGPYARKLATRNIVIVVDDTVFVHGALLPEHVRYGIARINEETKAWMRGDRPDEPTVVASQSSPTWSVIYSDEQPSAQTCKTLEEVLGQVGAKRMVVGHALQKGHIRSGCQDRIWSIDVGLAGLYGPASNEILEIAGDQVRVLGASVESE